MRHSDYRGLEKNAQAFHEEYDGHTARSVDEHYNIPFSPNSSSEFLTDSSSRQQQQHSLFSFVAPKQKKKKKPKDSAVADKLDEEDDLGPIEEKPPKQTRGRLPSREYSDIQFEMEPEEDAASSVDQGKFPPFRQTIE